MMSATGGGCVKTYGRVGFVEQYFMQQACSPAGGGPLRGLEIRFGAAQGVFGQILLPLLRFHTPSVGSGPWPCARKQTVHLRPNPVELDIPAASPAQTVASLAVH
jgi:hypothetical protein